VWREEEKLPIQSITINSNYTLACPEKNTTQTRTTERLGLRWEEEKKSYSLRNPKYFH
jgi:hypothetical protein